MTRGSSLDVRADAVVIGAGFGGLVAAALLARDGRSVRVLERDLHPGGLAASFERDTAAGRFRFAVGATLAAGLEPDGLLRDLLRRVGVRVDARPLDPAIRVHLPRGPVEVRATREGWAAELRRALPGQDRAKTAFWRDVQAIADAARRAARHRPVLPFRNVWDVLDTARAAHPSALRLLANLDRTVGGLLDRHGLDDPDHRAFLDGQLLDSMQVTAGRCALPNGAYALEVYRYGAHYVAGGLATIAQALAARTEELGGAVHYATRARRILVERGRAHGVEAGGRRFLAPVVVSTAPVADTARLLGDACPPELARRAAALENQWGALAVYLGVHESAIPEGAREYEQVTDHLGGLLTANFLVSTSPAWDRSRAPERHRAVTISTHVRASDWLGLVREDYLARKAAATASILDRLEGLWPGFRGGIVALETGTPRTYEAFTLHGGGLVGGVPQTPERANFRAQHYDAGLPGLILAGETVFPGQGTLGVALSGFNAYRAARRALGSRQPQHPARSPDGRAPAEPPKEAV